MKVEQTKGTCRLNGKSNVEKINTKDFGWIKKTNLSITLLSPITLLKLLILLFAYSSS